MALNRRHAGTLGGQVHLTAVASEPFHRVPSTEELLAAGRRKGASYTVRENGAVSAPAAWQSARYVIDVSSVMAEHPVLDPDADGTDALVRTLQATVNGRGQFSDWTNVESTIKAKTLSSQKSGADLRRVVRVEVAASSVVSEVEDVRYLLEVLAQSVVGDAVAGLGRCVQVRSSKVVTTTGPAATGRMWSALTAELEFTSRMEVKAKPAPAVKVTGEDDDLKDVEPALAAEIKADRLQRARASQHPGSLVDPAEIV